MTVLRFRPDFYIGTEWGGNRFPMTRWEVAQCLRLMRRDKWQIIQEKTSFVCTDLLTKEISIISPCSHYTVGALYEQMATE